MRDSDSDSDVRRLHYQRNVPGLKAEAIFTCKESRGSSSSCFCRLGVAKPLLTRQLPVPFSSIEFHILTRKIRCNTRAYANVDTRSIEVESTCRNYKVVIQITIPLNDCTGYLWKDSSDRNASRPPICTKHLAWSATPSNQASTATRFVLISTPLPSPIAVLSSRTGGPSIVPSPPC